jgi:hypothetical protein
MIEWFLLDGVDILRDELTIGVSVESPAFVLSNPADPEFAVVYFAVVVAEKTGNPGPLHLLVQTCFFLHGDPPLSWFVGIELIIP